LVPALRPQTDRGFTEELVRRAEASGYRALCLTVDAPVSGVRDREARAKVQLPSLPNLSGLKATVSGGSYRTDARQIYSSILDPALSWKDLECCVHSRRLPCW
jgi:4-hydroxymandelate oxidase